MKVSLKWLKERVDLGDRNVEDIDDLLTFAGIEVEEIHHVGVSSDKVVVAEILAAEPHPNADRLKVCQVDAGESQTRQIVCGAQNYKVGDKVPCALPGAELSAGLTIGETKMRGVVSRGMLCSGNEIGLADDVHGLMILDAAHKTGTPVREIFRNDTLIEVEITPNRPDLLSHTGLSRELAALFHSQLKELEIPATNSTPADNSTIVLSDTAGCPFYAITSIKKVKVAPSPAWLAEKIKSIGLNPINNIVDITNYVLHELGQPLHAFDAAQVTGGIHVRAANENETFLALDEETYHLLPDDCVISDVSGAALALGGVMGGLGSGITEASTAILLEAAWFTPSHIRRTSRRLDLISDSSYRFERGVDPAVVLRASALAAKLIVETAGGEIDGPTYVAGAAPEVTGTVALDRDRLNQLMDNSISATEADDILVRLGMEKVDASLWKIPPWRADLQRSVDLIEEVARVHGLDRVPSRIGGHVADERPADQDYDRLMLLKHKLVALGFYEAQTIKLISAAQIADSLPLKPLLDGDLIQVARPLSEDHAILRPSLVPGLVATVERNIRQGVRSLRFFEAGRQLRNAGGGKATDLEADSLALFMGGPAHASSWARDNTRDMDLYDLKAALAALVPNESIQLAPRPREGFLLAGDVLVNGKIIGVYAQLLPARCREIDLAASAFVAEIDLGKLLPLTSPGSHAEPLPQFPGSSRDIAMELPSTVTNAEIEKSLSNYKEPLLVEAHCFDMFRDASGEKLAADRKSIAWSFSYRAADRTLKSEEIDEAHNKVRDHLAKTLPVTFR